MWGNFLSLEDLDGDTLCKPWQRALRGFQEEGECSVKSSRALTWTSWSWLVGCWWSLLRSSLSHSSSSSGSSWPPDNRQIQTLLDFLVWYCIVSHNSHKKIFCDNFFKVMFTCWLEAEPRSCTTSGSQETWDTSPPEVGKTSTPQKLTAWGSPCVLYLRTRWHVKVNLFVNVV